MTLKLATVRENGEPTRRRAPRSEFTDEEWRLISELADHPNRLLITATPENGETYAEVAHEAIFRRWEKLRQWIADQKEFLIWKSGLEADRRRWEGAPEASKNDALLMGLALAHAQSWLPKRAEDLPKLDREFIGLSVERKTWEARRRTIRQRAFIGLALCVLLGGATLLTYMNYRNQAILANTSFELTVKSAESVVEQVGKSLDDDEISFKGARGLLQTVLRKLREVEALQRTPETEVSAVQLGLTIADIHAALGDLRQTYQSAKDAKKSAEQLLKAQPHSPSLLRLVFATSWRMGDALADQGNDRAVLLQALQEYEGAMAISRRLAGMQPDSSAHKRDVMFTHLKIGDLRQQQRDMDGAIAEYGAALGLIQSVVDEEPDNTDRQRDLANTLSRLGQALTNKRDFEAALKHYRDSYEIRSKLAAKDHDDAVLQSNVATSHYEFGKLYERRGELDAALTEYRTALEQRERLSPKNPSNASSQVPLATLYAALAEVLRKKGDLAGALDQHTKAFRIRQELAIRDSANPQRRQGVAIAMTAVADLRVALGRPKEALPVYSEVLDVLEGLASEQRNASNLDWQRTLVSTYIKFGDVLAATGDRTQALEQYKNVLTRAEKLTAMDPQNAGLAAQHQLIKTKIQQLEPQLSTEPRH
jgi:tetratricopeptide (TPR) repeat protein